MEEINFLLHSRRADRVSETQARRLHRLAAAYGSVADRLEGSHKPNLSEIALDIAKSLRGILGVLRDMAYGEVNWLCLPYTWN